jgi:hypothetical protein
MIAELITTAVGFVAGVAVWSYSTFQTKESARDNYQHIDHRLEQIEEMLKYLIRKNDASR